jgi:N-acetylneuraminic acid mutarotase
MFCNKTKDFAPNHNMVIVIENETIEIEGCIKPFDRRNKVCQDCINWLSERLSVTLKVIKF